MDRVLYRERNGVERLVGLLKEYRRIAARYDKLAASYLASYSSLPFGSGFENRL
jgi:transposase